ncbi:MAG TPA: DUF393 domain-containing protein [Casimicrobiaceae bacterium]|nr:DUF393 domain-containing protein [Casimicrobiaceae bacterium]
MTTDCSSTGARNGALTVYYDASCPVCVSEMNAVKSRDKRDALKLIDCSGKLGTPAGELLDREAMMALLHVRNARGEWLVGIPAYEAILAAIGFPRLARLVGSKRLRPVLDRLYAFVARNRYRIPARGFARLLASRAARNARAP